MDRETILQAVGQYYEAHHKKAPYQPGGRINYAGRVYDGQELYNMVDAALDFWLTAGRYTEQFERGLADYLGVPFCSMVNSGSSANLLAVSALASPLLGERRLRRGDEVITVAAGRGHHSGGGLSNHGGPDYPVRRGAGICGCPTA